MFIRALIFFLFISSIVQAANIAEIWITPKDSDYSRLSTGLAGSNITIISSEDLISQSEKNISEILKSYSGIQVRSLYSDVSGSNSTIDMRGFGEASKSNFLMLINGVRLNDLDMGGINFSNIPVKSIKRIEIIRGNSAATLYGSGAVGGAINIVMKDSLDIKNESSLNFATHSSYQLDFSTSMSINKNTNMLISGLLKDSDTYRDNADYEREDIFFKIQNNTDSINSHLDLNHNSKKQLMPGTRIIGGVYNYHLCNLLSASRTAKNIGGSFARNGNSCNTEQRDDYANEENTSFSAGFETNITESKQINFLISNRSKEQRAFYAANGNTKSTPNDGDRFIDTDLDNTQLSLILDDSIFIGDNPALIKYGFDYSDTDYSSNRHRKEDELVGQYYKATQDSRAFYIQSSLNLPNQASVLSFGLRNEKTNFSGEDTVDRNIDGFKNSWNATDHDSLSSSTTNTVINIGLEKIITENIKVFAKYAESFRTPNIDERIKSTTSGSFALLDQESDEVEFGIRLNDTKYNISASIYSMDTQNEIQYDQSKNTNLDPISREGLNLDFDYEMNSSTTLSGSYSYVQAEFTSGTLSPGGGGSGSCDFANTTYCSNSNTWQNIMGGGTIYNLSGKSVPLVSPNTLNLKLERKINSFNTLIFDLNYVDEKYVSNDPENVEPKIPDYYLANIKLRHLRGPMSLQIGINNLFNEEYYDFAVASTFHDDDHFGLSGVYPLAKRTAYVNLNYEF